MISTPQLKDCVLESDCQLRNSEVHFEQCALLSGPLQDHYSTESPYFQVSRLLWVFHIFCTHYAGGAMFAYTTPLHVIRSIIVQRVVSKYGSLTVLCFRQ